MCGHVDGGTAGQCCAGNACCGTAGTDCQTAHDGGVLLGVTYFDCFAKDLHTKDQAILAAKAWSLGQTVIDAPIAATACVCVTKGLDAAVWCYGSPWQGFGNLTPSVNCFAAQPPTLNTATTFAWH
jgi:hypothetical protein